MSLKNLVPGDMVYITVIHSEYEDDPWYPENRIPGYQTFSVPIKNLVHDAAATIAHKPGWRIELAGNQIHFPKVLYAYGGGVDMADNYVFSYGPAGQDPGYFGKTHENAVYAKLLHKMRYLLEATENIEYLAGLFQCSFWDSE
jgi:hypothetical protein